MDRFLNNKCLIISFTFLILIIFTYKSYPQNAKLKKPNFIILLADDLGYRDISSYGGVSKTPNIDELAQNGYLFTNFYAAAPNCSPSRAALLTGINPSRLGMYNYRAINDPMHLRDSEITIAEMLKRRGYQTGYFGKWHLGSLKDQDKLDHPSPRDQGFDYFFGTEANAQPSHLNPTNFIRNGKKLSIKKGYSCQIIADEVIGWLENNSMNTPYFMEIAFHEPHKKVASPENLIAHYPGYPKVDAKYLASVENLDLAIGRIYRYLEKTEQLKNTFILFTSDNGSYRDASNGELKGVKSYLYEGGIRVPGIIYYPALNNQATIIEEPVGLIDIFPTLDEMTSTDYSRENNLDGTSFLNLLEGRKFNRENPLFWFFYRTSPEIAMRIGDMMIMGKDFDSVPRSHSFAKEDMDYIEKIELDDYELYNLADDIKESNNIFKTSIQNAWFKKKIETKLIEIQKEMYVWKNFPKTSRKKKIKTKWVELPTN